MIQRWLLIILVVGVGLNETFHALYGIAHFAEIVKFIQPVLSMETTSKPGYWRAVDSKLFATLAYSAILIAHIFSGLLSLVASYMLLVKHKSGYETAFAGIGIGCILYFLGFNAIASGWFLMYQSSTHNFEPHAQRLFLCYMAVLLYAAILQKRA